MTFELCLWKTIPDQRNVYSQASGYQTLSWQDWHQATAMLETRWPISNDSLDLDWQVVTAVLATELPLIL